MALELTKDEETAFRAMLAREINAPQVEADLATAQADLDAVQAELQAARDVIQLKANADLNALEASYRDDITTKQAVVDATKAARVTADVRA